MSGNRRKNGKSLLWLTVAIGLALVIGTTESIAANDDVVVLKTGKTIRGVILEENGRNVEISTSSGSTYKIPRTRIGRIQKGMVAENRRRDVATDVVSSSESGVINEETGALKIGPFIGLNLANASLSPDYSTSNRVGFLVGGFFEAKITRLLYIEPELMYIQEGFSQVSPSQTAVFKYDALKLPIFLKLKFDPGRSDLRLHILAGPSFGIKLNSTTSVTTATGTTNMDNPNTQSLDVGLEFGGGLEYWVTSKIGLRLDLHYDLGLSNVSNQVPSAKNADTNIFAGVSFAL